MTEAPEGVIYTHVTFTPYLTTRFTSLTISLRARGSYEAIDDKDEARVNHYFIEISSSKSNC